MASRPWAGREGRALVANRGATRPGRGRLTVPRSSWSPQSARHLRARRAAARSRRSPVGHRPRRALAARVQAGTRTSWRTAPGSASTRSAARVGKLARAAGRTLGLTRPRGGGRRLTARGRARLRLIAPRRRRGRAARQADRRRAVLHSRRADRARDEGDRRPPARRPRRRPAGPRTRPRRARARVGATDRERARGAARRARRARRLRAVHAPRAEPRRPRRPSRADHVHGRPRDREGLRRRAVVPPRAGRASAPGCTSPTSRTSCRPAARSTAAPRSAPSRPTCRASSRRCCRTSWPTTRARCGRTRIGSASRSRCRPAASRSSTAR